MRGINVFMLAGWLLICSLNHVKANQTSRESDSPALEVGFTPRITAADLQIKRLTAVLDNDKVTFTLAYSSKVNRFLSFFNPPNGNIIKYVDHEGIKMADTIIYFSIKRALFESVDNITMRFSTNENAESDRNFIFLDLTDPLFVKLLGIVPQKIKYSDFCSNFSKNITSFKEYQDVRWGDLTSIENELSNEKIATLNFNIDSKFGKQTTNAQQIMEKAKNPGLGVRELHKQGITGKGVNVAIIDQNLPGKHPEYMGKIVKYKDFGCKQPAFKGSMHAPGVLSLLAGETIGTAPGANVYFAAAPSWNADAKNQADALIWIIAENRTLPKEDKIRVVSISAAPSGKGSPFKLNNDLWDAAVKTAELEGIIVLDCTSEHGFIGPCFYDINNPDDVKGVKVGWPNRVAKDSTSYGGKKVFAPCSFRTVAEEYLEGSNYYQYCGRGGLSWSIPYLAGVMAMGWQIKPEISGTEMVNTIIKTASPNSLGYKIINPAGFISYLKQLK